MSHVFTTPFNRASTASEVIEGVDVSGRRAIVTGANSGIGVETARALAAQGAEVTLAVRRPEAGEQVAADLRKATGNDAMHVARLDVSDLDSVRAFTAAWQGPLHILINNAGIMMPPALERGIAGHEQQFAPRQARSPRSWSRHRPRDRPPHHGPGPRAASAGAQLTAESPRPTCRGEPPGIADLALSENTMDLQLTDKVVIVTGATSGIGHRASGKPSPGYSPGKEPS
ncbi:SDR family NAD(P)-dependent oxidoreductase [Streptomyces sp. NPDC054813]